MTFLDSDSGEGLDLDTGNVFGLGFWHWILVNLFGL